MGKRSPRNISSLLTPADCNPEQRVSIDSMPKSIGLIARLNNKLVGIGNGDGITVVAGSWCLLWAGDDIGEARNSSKSWSKPSS